MNIKVDVTWDMPKVEKKITSLIDDGLMTEIHQLYAETVDPWTPFLTGALHKNFTVSPDSVVYTVPYARKKYYGEVYTKTHHPLATSHWDTIAMQTELPTFVEKVKELLKERARQLYG